MFKNVFSFTGRIGRKEYVITFIILTTLGYVMNYVTYNGVDDITLVPYLIIIIAAVWIKLSQAAKRCHDVNRSGWFQLIPFYDLYLLFAEGDRRRNEYGPDPMDKPDADD